MVVLFMPAGYLCEAVRMSQHVLAVNEMRNLCISFLIKFSNTTAVAVRNFSSGDHHVLMCLYNNGYFVEGTEAVPALLDKMCSIEVYLYQYLNVNSIHNFISVVDLLVSLMSFL